MTGYFEVHGILISKDNHSETRERLTSMKEPELSSNLSKSIQEMQLSIAKQSASEIMRNITNPYFDSRQGELHAILVRIIVGSHYLMNGGK